MKLRFYVDLYPGQNPMQYAVFATTNPSTKAAGYKRIAFDVTIPDNLLFSIDGFAAEVTPIIEIDT